MNETVSSKAMKFRWINGQCFEIQLPNGIHILTDPFMPSVSNQAGLSENMRKAYQIQTPFSPEDIEGADYIILNHTHGDHILQLEEIAAKFHSKVIVQSAMAMELAKKTKLTLTDIYPVDLNGTYYFPGFQLITFHGTHHPAKGSIYVERERMMTDFPEEMQEISAWGCLFNMNFILRTDENISVAFVGGDVDGDYKIFEQYHPQMILRNKLHSSDTEYDGAGQWSSYLEKSKALLMVPMHHEKWLNLKPGYTDQLVQDMNCILSSHNSPARVLNPERTQWYSLNLSIVKIENGE